jgi:hypothetical protein
VTDRQRRRSTLADPELGDQRLACTRRPAADADAEMLQPGLVAGPRAQELLLADGEVKAGKAARCRGAKCPRGERDGIAAGGSARRG